MNVRAHVPVSKAQFYDFVQSQAEGRYEYDKGLIVQQMTSGTSRHTAVTQRFVSIIERQLGTTSWLVSSHGRGVETTQTVRQPDVVVEPMPTDWEALSTTVPVVVVEVISQSTRSLDLNVKPGEYTALASLHAYIVAEQHEARCYVWLRDRQLGFPTAPREVAGLDASIDMAQPSIQIELAEVYRGIVIAS